MSKERLVELISKCCAKNLNMVQLLGFEKLLIADYLLANGVIVPPVKVGDVVYSYCSDFGVILPYVVVNFHVGFLGKNNNNYQYWEAKCYADETDELLDEIDFDIDEIGKTVFLTREEAEAKLKECKT